MSTKLPAMRFGTMAETLRRLSERGAVNAMRKEMRLSESQVAYIADVLRNAVTALSEMAAHEPVIRSLVEDKWGDEE